MAANGQANMTEMETILPGSGPARDGKYKITVSPAKTKDSETARLNNLDGKYYDPFKERKVQHPTSDCDTLTHLLKASLGTGILAMPEAFMNSGLTAGIFCTILVAVVCTHCSYIVVKCAHVLYYKTRVSSMSFADVGEAAFTHGPPWGRKFAKLCSFGLVLSAVSQSGRFLLKLRISIQVGLFASYFGTCSVYTVIIAKNFEQVVEYYLHLNLGERVYIATLLVPLILMSWVPNLKSLAPVSMVANVFMGLGLGITFWYLVQDMPSPQDLPQIAPLSTLPAFFSTCIFAMEAIGVVMPLENNMSTPQHFIGLCGVLNRGMGGVTMVYILLGFLGYVKYGADTKGSITLNLPLDAVPAQSVKILVALAVFFTYGLQYYVCLEIVWNGLKDRYSKNSRFAEYVVRTLLTVISVLLAVAVPTIGPFIGLIGAFCFSILGLIIPIFIEMVTYWDIGFGPGSWVIIKNIFLFIFGLFALVFGTKMSIADITKMYTGAPESLNITDSNVTSTVLPYLLNSTLASTLQEAVTNATSSL